MTTFDNVDDFINHLNKIGYVPDPKTMRKYPVEWKVTATYTADVWADSPEQAKQVVQDNDHGEWETLGELTAPFDIKVGKPLPPQNPPMII